MNRILAFSYGTVSYVMFLATLLYAISFDRGSTLR